MEIHLITQLADVRALLLLLGKLVVVDIEHSIVENNSAQPTEKRIVFASHQRKCSIVGNKIKC